MRGIEGRSLVMWVVNTVDNQFDPPTSKAMIEILTKCTEGDGVLFEYSFGLPHQ